MISHVDQRLAHLGTLKAVNPINTPTIKNQIHHLLVGAILAVLSLFGFFGAGFSFEEIFIISFHNSVIFNVTFIAIELPTRKTQLYFL